MLIRQMIWKLGGVQNASTNLFDEVNMRKNCSAGIFLWIQNSDLLAQLISDDLDRPEEVGVV